MTNLDANLVQSLRKTAQSFERNGVSFTLRATGARAGLFAAELEVVRDGEVVGYITPYSDREHGATKAALFGITAPRLFGTLEEAIDEIAS